MRRARSLNFPKFSSSKSQIHEEPAMDSPYHFKPGHSRDSSNTSSASSPVPSTFSNAGHGRWPGSTSSLETTPESPANLTKSQLHDLVEDPEERDDGLLGSSFSDEEYCICDTTNCNHRKTLMPAAGEHVPASPEWTHGDDQIGFLGLMDGPTFKRRRSGDSSITGPKRGHSRRWPSITKRWSDRKATTSISSPTVRSAPPSRSSSLQSPSLQRSLASHLGQHDPLTPPATPARSRTTSMSRAKAPPEPLDIKSAENVEDPVNREEQSTTPLLPPIMTSLRHRKEKDEVQSPLQSPSVAPSACVSASHTPTTSPTSTTMDTTGLSAKPSYSSITNGHGPVHSSQEVSTLFLSSDLDPWASRLGHANFAVVPEPYRPEVCDHKACNKLLEDWEKARARYMRHAARVTENYGPTSQTFKYTEQKWAEIDAIWRQNLDEANAEAEAHGETPASQSLAETQPISRIPTLNDPQQPNKFPKINEDEIVGPMVQYARTTTKPARRSTLLRLLTSPAALLGRRRPSV